MRQLTHAMDRKQRDAANFREEVRRDFRITRECAARLAGKSFAVVSLRVYLPQYERMT